MNNMQPSPDRRRSMRFSVTDGIVYLDKARYFPWSRKKKSYDGDDLTKKISSLHMKIGNIINISEGGIAFQYFSANGGIENLDAYTISVEFREPGIEIQTLSFKTKKDFAVGNNTLGLRQRCVQFRGMQSNESSCLMDLLESCQSKAQ